MELTDQEIIFRSAPPFYIKEKYGKKPNTVRVFNPEEGEEFSRVRNTLKYIKIINPDTDESFRRELTDITNFKTNRGQVDLWIFSWKNYELIHD